MTAFFPSISTAQGFLRAVKLAWLLIGESISAGMASAQTSGDPHWAGVLKKRDWWRIASILFAALVASVGLTACSSAIPASDGLGLSSLWKGYVLAPARPDVMPVAVVSTSGDVAAASALVRPRAGVMSTLTHRPGGPTPVIVVDYGEDVGGTPSIEVESAQGHPTLHTAYSEGLPYLSPTGDDGPSQTPTASRSRYEDFRVTGPGTVSSGEIQGGERYELISLTTPGIVTLRRVSIRVSGLRVGPNAYRGWFLSSSPLLNRIWYAGSYTTQLDEVPPRSFRTFSFAASNSMSLVMDGAKRDRKVWAGDLTVEGPTIVSSTDGHAYFRDSLALLMSYQDSLGDEGGEVEPDGPIGTFPMSDDAFGGSPYSVSYSMDVILGLASYYRAMGDLAFVRNEWQNVTRELAWNRTLVDSRGLLVTDATNGRDWDYYDGAKTGAVTAYNAIYVEALRDAAELAKAQSRLGEAATYQAEADHVTAAINQYLWDPGLGAYMVSDSDPGAFAQDGNALAILDGIAPTNEVPTILATMHRLWTTPYGPQPFSVNSGNKTDISPYVTNLEVQARFSSGDTSGALALIEQLWAHMLQPGPYATGTMWEVVDSDGAPALGGFTSLAHGWASGPTPDLSAYVLGIQPRGAGYRTWAVAPQPGPLRWAEGQMPTPYGPIEVHWTTGPNGVFTLDLTSPSGTSGVATVPIPSASSTIAVDGHRVAGRFSTTMSGAVYATVPVRGGVRTHITVTPERPR